MSGPQPKTDGSTPINKMNSNIVKNENLKTYSPEMKNILEEFSLLCEIPHGSGNEEAIGKHLLKRLEDLGLQVKQDEHGNILGEMQNADPGESASGSNPNSLLENRLPVVMLQAHMDMVIAGDVRPEDAAVHPMIEDGMLKSDGHTTLGADNGIGIAIILTLLKEILESKEAQAPGDPIAKSKPLSIKVLFTVSEEVGLVGAKNVNAEWLKGVDYFINLDSFHSDRALIGGKGGIRETFTKTVELENGESNLYEVNLSGFLGGHSGDDIDKGRCNAIQRLSLILKKAQGLFDICISDMSGGSGHNVIPSDCRARVIVPCHQKQAWMEFMAAEGRMVSEEYEDTDRNGCLEVSEIDASNGECKVWSRRFQQDVLDFLVGIMNGIVSVDDDGSIASSCNIGFIRTEEGLLTIGDMMRCDTRDQEEMILDNHSTFAKKAGFHVSAEGYHGWRSNPNSRLVNVVSNEYHTLTGKKLLVESAKSGLEPAFFIESNPNIEIVCLGPDIYDAHSVRERVDLSTVDVLYKLVKATVKSL